MKAPYLQEVYPTTKLFRTLLHIFYLHPFSIYGSQKEMNLGHKGVLHKKILSLV